MGPAPIRPQAERAGLRLGLGLLGGLLVVLAAVPLALLVRSQYDPLVHLDTSSSQAAEQLTAGSRVLLRLAQGTTLLGDPVLMTGLTAALALWLWRSGRGRIALYVLAARVGAMVLSTGLKLAVDRARPVFDQPIATAFGASFPSGHALGSSAFYSCAAVALLPLVRPGLRRALLVVAVVLPLLVAASRVLLGVHFLSDVTGGLLLGFGWVAVVTTVFAAWRSDEGRPVQPLEQGLDPEAAA